MGRKRVKCEVCGREVATVNGGLMTVTHKAPEDRDDLVAEGYGDRRVCRGSRRWTRSFRGEE